MKKSLQDYVDLFERELRSINADLADEFVLKAKLGPPRLLYLWLEGLRAAGELPAILESVQADFWWDCC